MLVFMILITFIKIFLKSFLSKQYKKVRKNEKMRDMYMLNLKNEKNFKKGIDKQNLL